MESLDTNLTMLLQWLLRATLQGSLLVCLILAAKLVLRERLPARWHYCLWLILLVRLALPWAPQSRLSIYNLIPQSLSSHQAILAQADDARSDAAGAKPGTSGQEGTTGLALPGAQGEAPQRGPDGAAVSAPSVVASRQSDSATGVGHRPFGEFVADMVPWLWLCGCLALGGYISVRAFSLWRAVASERPVTDQQILELLEDCKMQMRVRTIMGVVVTDKVQTPALYGFLRPRILLPQGLIETLGLDDLHYVFLHELAHLRRRDIYLAWLVCLLQVLHWFNPLIWFAFRRMRADQEMAADALALATAGTEESRRYGQTIVSLLERFSRPQYLPSLAGILETPSHIERRIQMITKFRQTSRMPLLAMVLLAVLGLITLTEAQNTSEGRKPASQPEEKTGLAPDGNAPVAPQVTGVSATETASLAGGFVTRRVLADASGIDGVLTADGKYIRGIATDTGDVIQVDVASGQRSRITNTGLWGDGENWYEYQLFSRDGKQLVYASYAKKEKDWVLQVRIRNLDGSGLRTLYSETEAYIRLFDWSPDAGSILAILQRKPNNWADELALISTTDGSVRVLSGITSAWYTLKMAGFSPDGRFVAYSVVREGSPPHGDVFLMTADGRSKVVVAGHPAEDELLGWTPDGTSLVFLSDRAGTWDIWSVPIAGGKQQGEPALLKKNFGWDSRVLGFAPDGSCYYQTYTGLGRLYTGTVDLETGKVLVPPAPVTTRRTGVQMFLRWSPDGRNLAYLSTVGLPRGPGNTILTIRSAATGEERFLSPRLRYVMWPSWAPDGRSLIATGYTETGAAIFRIDIETSEITKLADADRRYPFLCPDGKTLVVSKGGRILKRNLDTGEELEVAKAVGQYDLSPDGREVVFQVKGVINAVSLNGGEPRELLRGSEPYYGLEWTRDGRYVMALAYTRSGIREVWRIPAQGGTPLKLDFSVPKMASFDLHPDNRRIAFGIIEESKIELWVLENFLPAGMGVKDSK